jgi:hypothetical protein
VRTYTVVVTFTVHEHADEHIHTPEAVRDEVRSWLEGLNAIVHDVRVTETQKDRGEA